MISRVDAVVCMLAAGVPVRLSAFGGSMHPAIRSGELLVVEPVGQKQLGRGQVVLIRHGSQLVAHRIVRKAPGPRFLVAGDRSGDNGWLSREAVLGCVVGVMRGREFLPVPAASTMLGLRQLLGRFLSTWRGHTRAVGQCRGL
jgi:Peptidase S24-like